jgi:monoamine oxidase
MLDTAIIGAGVCGLALARALHTRKHDCVVFEARDRLGGRVHTERCPSTGASVDLGPTWFWPDTQPLMRALLEELGLAHFPQFAEGDLLILHDPEKKPTQQPTGALHGSARRVAQGMGSLVAALAASVPSERLKLAHELLSVSAADDHVRLVFRQPDGAELVQRARRVVLALPPRLAAEHVRFDPPLSAPLRSALAETPTWMASHAKAVLTVTSPRWRAAGLSGSAFVTHERAVLAEVFDATDPHATGAALGGFVALAPAQRAEFRTGLGMLLGSQATQLFGGALEGAQRYLCDWSSERFTCSTRDLHEPPSHEDAAHPALRDTHWGGRLFFGGSESASYAPGYLEGALDAARRLRRDVEFVAALAPKTDAAPAPVSPSHVDNGASLESFTRFARSLAERAFGSYRERVTRALAQQDTELLTQRAMLGAVEATYREALDMLESLPFDGRSVPIEAGRSALTPVVQAALGPFHPALFDQVVRFNGGSCALSNFHDEHELPRDYLRAIERDVAAAFREFCRAANAILVAKRS